MQALNLPKPGPCTGRGEPQQVMRILESDAQMRQDERWSLAAPRLHAGLTRLLRIGSDRQQCGLQGPPGSGTCKPRGPPILRLSTRHNTWHARQPISPNHPPIMPSPDW